LISQAFIIQFNSVIFISFTRWFSELYLAYVWSHVTGLALHEGTTKWEGSLVLMSREGVCSSKSATRFHGCQISTIRNQREGGIRYSLATPVICTFVGWEWRIIRQIFCSIHFAGSLAIVLSCYNIHGAAVCFNWAVHSIRSFRLITSVNGEIHGSENAWNLCLICRDVPHTGSFGLSERLKTPTPVLFSSSRYLNISALDLSFYKVSAWTSAVSIIIPEIPDLGYYLTVRQHILPLYCGTTPLNIPGVWLSLGLPLSFAMSAIIFSSVPSFFRQKELSARIGTFGGHSWWILNATTT